MLHRPIIIDRGQREQGRRGAAGAAITAGRDSNASRRSWAYQRRFAPDRVGGDKGRLVESVALVLGVFPDARRTPARAFVLANLLYKLELLRESGFLQDPIGTLPQNGDLLSIMLRCAILAHIAPSGRGHAAPRGPNYSKGTLPCWPNRPRPCCC